MIYNKKIIKIVKNGQHYTFVRNCFTDSSIECVQLLLNSGANVNEKENEEWTALMLASRNCSKDSSIECVQLLLNSGANVNEKENDGWTALMLAFKYYFEESSIECIKNLVKHDADIEQITDKLLILYIKSLIEIDNLKRELHEQKEKLLEEIYAPGGIGYQAAMSRFLNYQQ